MITLFPGTSKRTSDPNKITSTAIRIKRRFVRYPGLSMMLATTGCKMAEIILVTGGARSGKSTFAEKLALKLGNGRAAYIATAQIFDEEMAQKK